MTDILTCFHIPPQREFKAANELDRAGIGYELLTETITTRRTGSRKPVDRTVPAIRGYLPAERKPRDAKYIGRPVGPVSRKDMIRVATNLDRFQGRRCDNPFTIGQAVYRGEVPGTIAGTDGQMCAFAFEMMGKQHVRTIHYEQLRPG